MKTLPCFYLLISVTVIYAKLHVSVSVVDINNVTIKYSGIETNVITKEDVNAFNVNSINLNSALKKHYGRKPTNYYLKSPTPWGDLYKKYNWEEVKRVLRIKSARLKSIDRKQVIVHTQDFENYSNNKTVTVNTALSDTVENSFSSSWTKSHELTVSQEIKYDLNVIFAKLEGTTGISYTSSWGKSVEKTETVTIGTTAAMETELAPRQAAKAVLTATRGIMEVEVVYVASLRGNVAVNFKKPYEGHHFKAPQIQNLMDIAGLSNELITTETIKVGLYTDASLKVYDKATNMPL